jgi:hypothetical protein
MRVMLEDMDLTVSEVECLSMGMGGREERDHLVKFSSAGRVLTNLHPAGVGHVLLATINAIFWTNSDVKHDAWFIQ